ncbi:MAG: TetR/AcrR family transcriptional regulator [Oscillospiraceae bacterium]|nr:TetR/AcrR family transcriptional regulator [Oscillospiraceae bacterium]
MIMEQITDLRIRRTHRLLADALIALMQEKAFEKITVIEICAQAMVHRATFYKYFEDKYQLLDYCVHEIGTRFIENAGKKSAGADCRECFLNMARGILTEFEAHKDTYITILKRDAGYYLTHKMQDMVNYELTVQFERICDEDGNIGIPPHALAHFYSGACINIMYWWVDNGLSVEEVMKYMENILNL